MKILIVVDMQKDFISGPLGTAEARAIVPYVAEKAKNTPRENLFVTLDTHQPNYMETNEGHHLPGAALHRRNGRSCTGQCYCCRCGRHSGVPHHPASRRSARWPCRTCSARCGTADGN